MGLDLLEQGNVFVQDMVQKGLNEVPARFLQHHERAPALLRDERAIPVIDMLKVLQQDAGELSKLRVACSDWGFFQIVNHGIPVSLLHDARETCRQFFGLSQEEKVKCSIKPGSYQGYGRHFVVSEGVAFDWVDLLYHDLRPASTREMSSWPKTPANYRVVIENYSEEVYRLAKQLLAAISKTVNMEPSFFEQRFGEVTQGLRINYYPPCPQPDLVMGLSPHSDPGGITILLQDEVEGLQVRKDGEWIQVKAYPEAFVVNIADQIEILTNGRYKSVEHRAVIKSQSKERISLAMFHSPSPDALISPAPELVEREGSSLYSSMTFRQYKSSFLNKELQGKSHVHSLLVQK